MFSRASFFNASIAVILYSATSSVLAGPPFVTDDPEPVETQHWEINYAFTKTLSANDTSMGMPIDINYGATSNLQLHVQPRYSYDKSDGESHTGIDNTEIGAKYRFLQHEDSDSSFMMSLYPLIELPTGRSEFGPDRSKTQIFLPLWLQYVKTDWTVYGGGGYRINQVRYGRNSVFTGITALYRLDQRVQIGGELFNETSAAVGEPAQSDFNVGGIYTLAEDYNVLFSIGKGLRSVNTNQFSIYAALQVVY